MSKSQPPPQQQPLPQSIILGCNAFNCASKISNANWETKLNEQVNVNQGDSIGVKASFIDTRGTASGNIVIPRDTEISLEYYFYWIHCFNACLPPYLTPAPASATALDASDNLTQQVLIGSTIESLYQFNNTLDPSSNVPAYMTVPDLSHNFFANNQNSADGLPYIVYQSTPDFPVPAVYGPVIPASEIVVGSTYQVITQGLTTNWAYAGVPDASYNILPAGWVLNESSFVAAANPNGVDVPALVPLDTNPGMSPNEFLLPINVQPTLPYVSYMITDIGDTDWTSVDPSANPAGVNFSASLMVNDGFYTIATPGNLDWTVYGAGDNFIGTEFKCTIPPPAPPVLPIVLTNAFFTANPTYFHSLYGTVVFGATVGDTFTCTIDVDGGGNLYVSSFVGNSSDIGWLYEVFNYPSAGEYYWTIPSSVLGFSAGTPGVGVNLVINTDAVYQNPTTGEFSVTAAPLTTGGVFINGIVYDTNIHVGTIIRSINPVSNDASTGRAVIYPTPNPYDGTVRQVISTATTKVDIRPVKKKWKMVLKKGSYDPQFLAQLITRNMSQQKLKRVNQVKGGPFGTQSTLTVPTDSIYNNNQFQNGTVWTEPVLKQNVFYDSKNPKVYDIPPTSSDYNGDLVDQDDMCFLFTPAMNSTPLHASATPLVDCSSDFIWCEIPHPNATGLNNLPNPVYNINLVPLLSDVKSVSKTLPNNVKTDYYTILPFYSHNSVTNTDGTFAGSAGILPVTFGATETSLLYNNEGNNLYSFDYLHSPIYAFLNSATSDLTEATAHMYTVDAIASNMNASVYTTLIDKKSGILLHKMEPASFWEQLGFVPENITVNLEDKIGYQMTLNDFERKTTGGFCGSANVLNPIYHTSNSADQPYVADTENVYLSVNSITQSGTNVIAWQPDVPNTPGSNGLVIGTEYLIVKVGQWGDQFGNIYPQGWDFCGGPAQESVQVGDTFTATAPPANPYGWTRSGCYPGWPTYGFTDPAYQYPLYYGSDKGGLEDPYCVPVVSSANIPADQLQNLYFQVQNTNVISADTIPTVKDQAGHYLISIEGYNSIYLNEKSKYEIKSIVSSYFVSQGSFVAQVFPESYRYFHVGAPISLSNLKIRILDPYTLEEAEIGPNSSVYIQVDKMLTELAIAQFEN